MTCAPEHPAEITPLAAIGDKDKNAKLRICIVSHNAYGAIRGGESGFIGGVEWQTSLLARWLADQGHKVSLLTWDEGGPSEEWVDGVRVLKICRQDSGLPGLRFVYPKWSGLVRALRQANADVYYQNGGECVTGQVALWCRRNRKAFVFSTASDADCQPGLPELRTTRERLLYRHGLSRADRVIVQTRAQQYMLSDQFRVDSVVIPMSSPGPSEKEFDAPKVEANRVLWIGRVCQVKRPDRLLEIAAACPDIQFDLVGPIYSDNYGNSVALRARAAPNITVHGAVSRKSVAKFYRGASLLCCTSDYEGFPNTFLEACSYGLPIVSRVDPDSFISENDLGIVGAESESLAIAIQRLLGSPSLYAEKSCHARQYYLDNHQMDVVLPRMEEVFCEVKIRNPSVQ